MNCRTVNSGFRLFVVLACLYLPACSESDADRTTVKLAGLTMGTTWSVIINEPGFTRSADTTAEINAILDVINQSMSTWIPDSELMQLNANTSTEWQSVSPELYEVIATARQISEKSSGAFDVTVGPLVNLWGFGPEGIRQVPAARTLEETRAVTGYQLIELDTNTQSLRKQIGEIFIDLSAIAKGCIKTSES